ncbi:MAG TPA: S8 family serine peptidase, partial [Verrucomicrobiae bacterium]|nr:S8 family serine peptidase [Verrucomicrobiae bacterium]
MTCKLLLPALVAFAFQPILAKPIRLRNELIESASATNRAVMAGALRAKVPASGVFLIQFSGPLEASSRAELHAAGVELIKYVPDDAFIAKFNNVSAADIAAKSFVIWIGPYRAEYKVHPRLAATMSEAAKSNQTVSVNILLSPTATSPEMAAVRSLLAPAQSESHLRQGTIVRGELPPNRLDALAQSGAVLWIEKAPKRRLVDEAASKIVGGEDGRVSTPTVTEQRGFNGTNVIVCVADTGLDSGSTHAMHPDLRGRVLGFKYYGSLTNGSDGYGHGTHCAGIVAGNAATGETDPDTGAFFGLGVASGASLFIERIFDESANEVSPF